MTGTPIPGKRPHELPDRLVKEHLVFAKAPNEEGVFYRYRRDCQGKMPVGTIRHRIRTTVR